MLLLLLAFLSLPAHAQSFPQFSGFVVDAANVIPDAQEAALSNKLDALQKNTGTQLIVATVPDLQGYPIEDYGYRLGRAWGVGLKGANNGAILIVAPNDRKVRIEVGYGLEPILTDALSSLIVNGKIVPAFKAGDIPGGIEAGADALIEQLSLPDAEAKARVAAAAADYDKAHAQRGGGGVPFGLIFWGIILAFVILGRLRRGAGGRRYSGGGLWPLILWGPGFGGGSGGGSSWGGGSGWGGGSSGGGGWGGGGFGGGGGGSFGGGGASGSW